MRAFYYLGWGFLAAAFALAAAETIPRALPGGDGVFVSAYRLWYAGWPGSLVITQIQVEKVAPFLWDPVILGVLQLPAWLLAGMPGGALIWFFRPRRDISEQEWEDLRKQEESLALFDQLSREARNAGYGADEDDQRPDHGGHDIIDDPGAAAPYSDDALYEDLGLGDIDVGGEPPQK